MGYRTQEERDLTEPEAYALACARAPFPLHRAPSEYRWGWVYRPNTDAFGPGPVSVTLRGEVLSFGSVPYAFSEDAPPVDPFAARKRTWLERLVSRRPRMRR